MKVRELIELLSRANPEDEVVINDNGSICQTGLSEETAEYNIDQDTNEFYIVTAEWEFEEDE